MRAAPLAPGCGSCSAAAHGCGSCSAVAYEGYRFGCDSVFAGRRCGCGCDVDPYTYAGRLSRDCGCGYAGRGCGCGARRAFVESRGSKHGKMCVLCGK